MRLVRRRRRSRVTMNMAPMIDIVLLMLVFFLTVSQVARLNRGQLELPQLSGGAEQPQQVMAVNVRTDGGYELAGRQRDLSQLRSDLQQALRQVGGQTQRLVIVVRADRRGSSGAVNRLVNLLRELQIKQVRIAVRNP